MNKILSILLVVLMSSPMAYARDWDKEDKYSNPRPRGSDSVYDEPRTSGYDYQYKTSEDSGSDTSKDSGSSSYGYGTTSDSNHWNNNGLIIRKD